MNTAPRTDPRWAVFDYEVTMFRSMCDLLRNGNREYAKLPHWVQNAVTESALLHTRQLADILLSRGSEPDDIKLQQLLPSFQEQSISALLQHYGKSRDDKSPCWTINKRMAHATTQRGDNFDYSTLLNKLVPLIEAVLEEVEIERSKKQR